MKFARLLPILSVTAMLAACASTPTAITRMAADDTACDPKDIEVTELDAPLAYTHRYQTVGCGTTHNYVCPTWQYYAMSAMTLHAMSTSTELIDLDDPTHCMREKR